MAEMMTGTMIGEISRLMMMPRAGKRGRLSPRAASVPRMVETSVTETATMMLIFRAEVHRTLVKKSSYQRKDRPGIG